MARALGWGSEVAAAAYKGVRCSSWRAGHAEKAGMGRTRAAARVESGSTKA
jgi:hypothetical protein